MNDYVEKIKASNTGSPSNAVGLGRELAITRSYPAVVSTANFPILSRTNYGEWAILMEIGLQARGLWTAIQGGEDLTDEIGYRNDRSAMEVILRSVPTEMISTIGKKETAHEAWEAIKTIRMGSNRVRDAKAQTLRREFELFKHKDGETVDELAMRLTGIVAN